MTLFGNILPLGNIQPGENNPIVGDILLKKMRKRRKPSPLSSFTSLIILFPLFSFRCYGNTFILLIRICSALSVLSVCMNTPQTFIDHPLLRYVTLLFDIVIAFVLLVEMILKMRIKGLLYQKHSYLRSPGRHFELFMLSCIIISIILQVAELTSSLDRKVSTYLIISFIRIPRPLLMLRVINASNLKLPSNVAFESIRQIGEIILYMLYFLISFALIGGQLFGAMDYFCVQSSTIISNITYSDFTIPIRRCPPEDSLKNRSNVCPKGYNCTKLTFNEWRKHKSYFNNIFESFITIYEAMSLEGWSLKMYESMDNIPAPLGTFVGFLYFFLVLLIIALLGRNVFIAVITEAFADMRVVLNKCSTVNTERKYIEHTYVLRKVDKDIKLVHVEEAIITNEFRRSINMILSSKPFVYFIHTAVLLDAIIQGFLCNNNKLYNLFQFVFTVLFDVEAILKIVGMGFKYYASSSTFQFEGIVCVGSTILLPLVTNKHKEYSMFQVVRLFRLVLLWSSLQLFLRKILGSAKKICQFSLFTLIIIFIAAGMFLQVFCGFGLKVKSDLTSSNGTFIRNDTFSFHTFPYAFKAAFQIFTQDAWSDMMEDLLDFSGEKLAVVVYVFILTFHLLAATILVSVFVALILDNLELQEELKIVKQRRLGQEISDTRKKLPMRIRIFEWFKAKPKVINLNHVEYIVPPLRESFVTSYLESADTDNDLIFFFSTNNKTVSLRRRECHTLVNSADFSSCPHVTNEFIRKKSSVTALIKEIYLNHTNTLFQYSSNNSGFHPPSNSIYRTGERNTDDNVFCTTAKTIESNFVRLTRGKKRNKKNDLQVSSRFSDYGIYNRMEEAQNWKDERIENLRNNQPKFDESLFIFSSNGMLRKYIHKIVHARYKAIDHLDKGVQLSAFSIDRLKRYFGTQTYLEWTMIFTTWVSLFGMIIEFSKDQRLFDNTALITIEVIFIFTSTVELLFRIIADGFILGPEAMIRDFGDVLHLLIYIVSLIYVAWQPLVIKRFSGAYSLLVLRCLRPLRLITLCLPLRKEVLKVVGGYKDLLKVFILLFLLIFVFASYGVQTFSNKLMKCNDANISTKSLCVGFFEMELAKPVLVKGLKGDMRILVPRVWSNPRTFDFDTMGHALLALLEMLSLEGWTEIRDAIESLSVPWGMVYPHLYVFLAGMIGLTLVIGVIVSNYNESKGTALLTVEQKRWKDLKRKLELAQPSRLPPKPLENERKCKLYDTFLCTGYLNLYCTLVLINSITLLFGQVHYGQFNHMLQVSLDIIGFICCFIFLLDAMVKIYTFSLQGYLMSWGNRIDFILMIAGIIFILWNTLTCHYGNNNYSNHANNHLCHDSRTFGMSIFILRFLTLSFKHNALRMLMLTILMGVIKSFWTLSILVVIMFTYGYIGIIFFGSVKRGFNLNSDVNFETFGNTILLLIRIATGKDWNRLMHDAMISKPYCRIQEHKNYWESNCGNRPLALLYFHSYIWLITYFLLNVLIAVVIDNFSLFYLSDNDPIMSQQDIQVFPRSMECC